MSDPHLSAADVSVVIPSGPGWERWEMLQMTLRGLARQSVSGFETVLAVDSGDEPPAGLGDVRVVVKPDRGPGPRRNAGARAATRPIVLLLGDDTIPGSDLVARHVAEHARHPEAEVAVLGHIDWHPDVRRGRLERWLDWSRTQFDYPAEAVDDAGFGRFYSSNISLKRSFFLDVGGFDEEFGFGYEDTDLGLRLHHKGLRIRYQPAARAEHLHRYTWDALRRRFSLVGEGEYLMTKKHPGFEPFFLERILNRRRAPWWLPWPWLVELVPEAQGDEGPGRKRRLRRELEARADAWYYARLTGDFVTGWVLAAEADERRQYRHQTHGESTGPGEIAPATSLGAPSDADLVDAERWAARGLAEMRSLVPKGARVLDVGDEVRPGSNGLRLLSDGYDVSFAGLSEGASSYLRWRLERRGLASSVHDGPVQSVPGTFDAAYACAEDGSAPDGPTLDALEARASLVIVRVTERAHGGTATVEGLFERAGSGLVRYRRLGGHHLVAYRPGSGRPRNPVAAAVRRFRGRALPAKRAWYPDPRW